MSASYLQGIHNICSVNDFGKSRYNWVHDKACNNRQRGIHTMSTGIMFKATQSRYPEFAEVLVLKMFTNQGNPRLSYYPPLLAKLKSVMVISQNKVHWYKFTVVYCESVNLIGLITVDHLLIVYGNIVVGVTVPVIFFYIHQYTWRAMFEPNVT